MKAAVRFTLSAAAAALMFQSAAPAFADPGATYEVTVTGLWTAERFPLDYPKAGVLTGPHFSGVIGVSHNGQYALFQPGMLPTPGLERLSEEQSVKGTVRVDLANPHVSAVAMIAPSPDWFAGVADVSLVEGGKYVAEKSADLYAWDAGGDDGITYTAADKDVAQKRATAPASARHFGQKPVARITFRRL
jgi:hypothetical protein